MTSSARPPTAHQSRRASSSSLSDWESQSARLRPRSHWSRTMAATCLPLPQPVPSPSIQPRRKRTGSDSGSSASTNWLPSSEAGASSSPSASTRRTVSQPAPMRYSAARWLLMRLAGQDHALELGIGQQPLGQHLLRQHRAVGRHGVRHRRHGPRLHQRRRVLDRPRHVDARCPPPCVGTGGLRDSGRTDAGRHRLVGELRDRDPSRGGFGSGRCGAGLGAPSPARGPGRRGPGRRDRRPARARWGCRSGTVPMIACSRMAGVAHGVAGIDPGGLLPAPVEDREGGVSKVVPRLA